MNINNDTSRHLKGYAAALQDILYELTGDNCNSKSYDLMTIGDKIHSYRVLSRESPEALARGVC